MNQRNTAVSVRARLLTRARETRQDFNLVLTRYALERLLYRLSISPYADQFLLKGALLFDLWFDIPHRPTRDADFLGFGSAELPHLEAVFKDVCAMETDDGVTVRPDTVQAAEIRKEANYAGVRVTLLGLDCLFRRNWTPIPFETGQSVHGKVDSRSEATHGVNAVYSGSGSFVNFGFILRRDSPTRLRLCA